MLVDEHTSGDIDAGGTNPRPVGFAQCGEGLGRGRHQFREVVGIGHVPLDAVDEQLELLRACDARVPV